MVLGKCCFSASQAYLDNWKACYTTIQFYRIYYKAWASILADLKADNCSALVNRKCQSQFASLLLWHFIFVLLAVMVSDFLPINRMSLPVSQQRGKQDTKRLFQNQQCCSSALLSFSLRGRRVAVGSLLKGSGLFPPNVPVT